MQIKWQPLWKSCIVCTTTPIYRIWRTLFKFRGENYVRCPNSLLLNSGEQVGYSAHVVLVCNQFIVCTTTPIYRIWRTLFKFRGENYVRCPNSLLLNSGEQVGYSANVVLVCNQSIVCTTTPIYRIWRTMLKFHHSLSEILFFVCLFVCWCWC